MARAHLWGGHTCGEGGCGGKKALLANKAELQSEDHVHNLLTAGRDKSQLFPINFSSAYLQNEDSFLPQGLL